MSHVIYVGSRHTFIYELLKQDGTGLDVSAAQTRELHFLAPDGTELTKSVAVVAGEPTKVTYTTVAGDNGDLNMRGQWRNQVYVDVPGVYTGWFDEDQFAVEDHI